MEMVNILKSLTCGGIDNFVFNDKIPTLISSLVSVIKIAVPVLLIVFGSIDLAKGVVASKEDEIKKGQQTFFKRLIAGLIVFFVVTFVQIAVNLVGEKNNCINCFINNKCTAKGATTSTTPKPTVTPTATPKPTATPTPVPREEGGGGATSQGGGESGFEGGGTGGGSR
jgi:Predicted solute binding protein